MAEKVVINSSRVVQEVSIISQPNITKVYINNNGGGGSNFNLKVNEIGETPLESINQIEFDGAEVSSDGPNKAKVIITGGGVSLIRQEFVFTSSQVFTLLSNYSQVYSVEVQGQGALSTSQYDLIAPNQVEILDTLDASDYVVVIYSANTGGVIPYYTQAQVDALIAGIPPPSKTILSKSVVNSTAVTGTTANVFPYVITIPANTVQVGDIISFKGRIVKTGTNGVVSFRLGDVGEPLRAFCQTSASSQLLLEMSRDFVVKSATDTEALSVAINGFTSEGAYTEKISYNIDWTIDQDVSIGLNLQNALDSALISYYEIYIS